MNHYPSRSERRQIILYTTAERGNLSVERMLLYLSEIRKLQREGFSILNIEPSKVSNGLFSVTVDWSHAYGDDIPHIVYSYIHNIIETYPKSFVNTFAQELYVIAHRVNAKK